MNLYLPGDITQLDHIDPGTCIIFAGETAYHVGVVLEPVNGSKGILDFESQEEGGEPSFQIYNGTHFENEAIVRLSRARIVPSVVPEDFGRGQHPGGRLSKALYLTDTGPVVYAAHSGRGYKLKLSDGTRHSGDLAFSIHATRWRIEVEDGAGDFKPLREFIA